MKTLSAPPALTTTIDLIGFPMDLGANRRGVDMGPAALRIASIHEQLQQLGYTIRDLGDVGIEIRERLRIEDRRLKYLDEIAARTEELSALVLQSLTAGRFPLCLGGDHTVALGSLAGVAAHCRATGRTPGVLWVDAHGDLNTEQTTPSGNIHGMILAASLGIGHPGLTQLLGFSPKILPENCILVGLRQLDSGERALVRDLGLTVYTMTDIDRRGLAVILDEILARFRRSVTHLHLSFDLDSIDPAVARGVGTPVPGGLSYREAHLLMETIADCGCLNSMDLAEVNPILDLANQSAEFAVSLLASMLGKRIL